MKKLTALLLTILIAVSSLTACSKAEKSYEKLDEYITATVLPVNGVHTLTLGSTAESDGATYTRTAVREENRITLVLTVTEGEEALYTFSLIMNKGALTAYRFEYESSSCDTMYGMIIADEYVKAAYNLSYLATNISDAASVGSASGLSKSLCNYLLEKMEQDLAPIKLTAVDFDFKDYKD